jgi:ubiquinol oxidase
VDANEELLKSLPPPLVAAEYYRSTDLYMFDEFQTAAAPGSRRPAVDSLYDVFANIRDDEGQHVATMKACQQLTISGDLEGRKDTLRPL